MHEKFRGYYKPTQQELTKAWREAIFVFDTSVLLNIYRYTPKTREDFFKILEQLNNRIWIPHQVAYEYFEQRENVIAQQDSIYEDIEGTLSFLQKNVINKYKKGHPFADTNKIKTIFEEAVEKAKSILREAQSEHPDLLAEDIHLDRLTQLLKDDQIGDEFPKERVHKIYAEGEQRYKENIPPGYADKKDKDGPNKYGDLLLWYQLIEHAKSQNKPIIFITDDEKEDWWRIKENKVLGPRPELIQEIYDKAKVTLYMYLADEFIKRAQEFLDIQVQQSTIEEAREVRQTQQDSLKLAAVNRALANLFRTQEPLLWIPERNEQIFHTHMLATDFIRALAKSDRALLYQALFKYLEKEEQELEKKKQNSEAQNDNKTETTDQEDNTEPE